MPFRPPKTLFASFAIALLLSSCGVIEPIFHKKTGTNRWGELPVKIYVSAEIAQNPATQSDLQAAFQYWEKKAGQKLFDYQGQYLDVLPPIEGTLDTPEDIKDNVIFYPDHWEWEADVAGKTKILRKNAEIQGGIILLHRGMQFCYGPCANNPTEKVSFRRLLTHELGHFLGLDHDKDPTNIMYVNLMPDGLIEQAPYDKNALRAVLEPFD